MQIVSMETVCMKCQSLFSGKSKKNIINMSAAELAHRVVMVKLLFYEMNRHCVDIFFPISKIP